MVARKKRPAHKQQSPAGRLEQLRQDAEEFYRLGAMQDAFECQEKLIAHKKYLRKTSQKQQAADYSAIVNTLYHLSAFEKASVYAQQLVKLSPENSANWENLGACYMRFGKIDECIAAMEKAQDMQGHRDNANIWDSLAHAYGEKGDSERVREAGRASLKLKAQKHEGIQGETISNDPPPAFNSDTPEKNIIAFSLFGDDAMYCETAVLNVREAKIHYPGWRCRFYCDESVPPGFNSRLEQSGAEVKMMPKAQRLWDGLFWRFLVMDDDKVERFLIRDCDSLVNKREAVAVAEWLNSGKYFHLMRDYYTHTELILAGMFGGVQGAIRNIEEKIESYKSRTHVVQTHMDQHFLREMVWPTLRQSLCSHDAYFDFEGATAFPIGAELPDGQNVGKNAALGCVSTKIEQPNGTRIIWRLYEKVDLKAHPELEGKAKLVCEYSATVQNGSWVGRIPDEYVEKIQNGQMILSTDLLA